MAISKELIRQAVKSISEIEGVYMDAAALVEDCALLSKAFPAEADYMAACASTRQALEYIVKGRVSSSDLKYDFAEWKSYHYQHRVGQGIRATCRIMYRVFNGGIEVKGFGHRRMPVDFYARMSDVRGWWQGGILDYRQSKQSSRTAAQLALQGPKATSSTSLQQQ